MKAKNTYLIIILILCTSLLEFCNKTEQKQIVNKKEMIKKWIKIKGKIKNGKIVYASPPNMYVLYLNNGIKKKIPGIIVEGGGRKKKKRFNPKTFLV